MQDLWLKFKKVKKSISGNREKKGFEFTFGLPQEEGWNITPVNKWNRRIMSELEFALNLAAEQKNETKEEFDNAISKALDYLLECIENDGVLTNLACEEAEKILLPLKDAAKEYGLILAAHAHIDMNWMWGWQETVAITRDTFRTMLNLMDEYKDFCFSQSQASVYKIIEDFDPDMMDRMKARIKEGRWEITATAWVETDKNMPNTESLLRHIKYTRDYLREHWDIDPATLEVDFSPDTFGHSANVPEINSFGNVKYYYHCRGLDGDEILYRWKAPSGKEVLVCREHNWYNRGINTEIAPGLIELSRRCGGLKTGLVVYGVGDHGGGATRRDIERAIEMMDYPVYPKIKFGTLHEYFKLAESVRNNLNILDTELNYCFPGCYTTQSRIKLGNRKNEKALLEADTYSTLSKAYLKAPYHYRQFERAWQNVLFTHFHDILTGSCVQESREHAMGIYSESMAVANTQHSNALRIFAENIDTSSIQTDENTIKDSQSEGAGVGFGMTGYTGVPNPETSKGLTRIFHVFNSLPFERTQNVEITVWDWVGDMRYISIENTNGEKIDFALIDHNLQHYWDHKYFRFIANVTVPAMGYTTIILKEEQKNEYIHYFHPSVRTSHAHQNYILENEYIKAEFDSSSGSLISMIDKENNENILPCGKTAGLEFIQTETASSSAWMIGHYMKTEPINTVVRTHPIGMGNLRNGFYVERKIYNSTIKETVYLEKGAKALTYKLNIDWNETAGSFVPVLHYNFPIAYNADGYLYDIPAGAQKRQAMHLDVPGLQYGAAINPDKNKKSLVIASDCKYGYRAYDNNLSTTLINSSSSPDPYPERGIHNITLFVGLEFSCPKTLEDFALDVNHQFNYVPTNSHAGVLPLEKSLMSFESETAVLSSVTMSQDGDVLVRFYETCGKECDVSIGIDAHVISAVCVDLMENETRFHTELIHEINPKSIIKTKIGANCIGTVKIKI